MRARPRLSPRQLPLNHFGAEELLGDIEQRCRCTACGWRRADLRPWLQQAGSTTAKCRLDDAAKGLNQRPNSVAKISFSREMDMGIRSGPLSIPARARPRSHIPSRSPRGRGHITDMNCDFRLAARIFCRSICGHHKAQNVPSVALVAAGAYSAD